MSKAEAVCVRTVDEGAGIPTKESHAVSYRSAKWIFDVVRRQKLDFLQEEVDAEEKMAEIEVRSLLNKVFEVGDGDVAIGLQGLRRRLHGYASLRQHQYQGSSAQASVT